MDRKTEFVVTLQLAKRAGVLSRTVGNLLILGVIEYDAIAWNGKTSHPLFLKDRVDELVATIKKHQAAIEEEVAA